MQNLVSHMASVVFGTALDEPLFQPSSSSWAAAAFPHGKRTCFTLPLRRNERGMRHYPIALGACLAALAIGSAPAFAQTSMSQDNASSTYQAARQAGAAAQKVAPPNLVLPADMGGGTWGQRNGSGTNTGTETNTNTGTGASTGTGTGTMSPSGSMNTNSN